MIAQLADLECTGRRRLQQASYQSFEKIHEQSLLFAAGARPLRLPRHGWLSELEHGITVALGYVLAVHHDIELVGHIAQALVKEVAGQDDRRSVPFGAMGQHMELAIGKDRLAALHFGHGTAIELFVLYKIVDDDSHVVLLNVFF
jgi:hypothetical protein